MRKKAGLTGGIYIIISAVLFGVMPLMTRIVFAHGANGYTAAFFRYAFGSVVLWALICSDRSKSRLLRISRRQMASAAIFSLFYSMLLVSLFLAYSYIDTGLATALHFTYPAIVIVLNLVVFRSFPAKREIVSLCLAIAGVFLMNAYGGAADAKGMAFAILSGVSLALFVVFFEHNSLKDLPTVIATFWISLLAAAVIGAFITITGNWQLPADAIGWAMMVVLAISTGVVAFVCFQKGIKTCGGVMASILSMLEPVISLFIGWSVFHEKMSAASVLAVVCILCSATVLLAKPE